MAIRDWQHGQAVYHLGHPTGRRLMRHLVTMVGLGFFLVSIACGGGGGGGGTGGPTPPPQNQPPSLTVNVTIEVQSETEATVRVVGSATDSDGTVVRIECQGEFSGSFGSTLNVLRTVTKLIGMSRNYGTTCVATDNDGATASAADGVLIAAAPIVFSGTGNVATGTFTLEGGFIVFTSQHSGDSNFIVWLRNSQGELVQLIANEIGGYSGTRGFSVPAGQYLLDIEADGAWQIDIEEPRPTTGSVPPLTVTNAGDEVVGPLQLSAGLARFDLQHTGDSNFIVWLYRSDGQRIVLLANEIGNTSGSTAENIPTSGLYYLDVQADGTWEIVIQ